MRGSFCSTQCVTVKQLPKTILHTCTNTHVQFLIYSQNKQQQKRHTERVKEERNGGQKCNSHYYLFFRAFFFPVPLPGAPWYNCTHWLGVKHQLTYLPLPGAPWYNCTCWLGVKHQLTYLPLPGAPWYNCTCWLGVKHQITYLPLPGAPWYNRTCWLGVKHQITYLPLPGAPWYNCTCWLGVKHQLTYLPLPGFPVQKLETVLVIITEQLYHSLAQRREENAVDTKTCPPTGGHKRGAESDPEGWPLTRHRKSSKVAVMVRCCFMELYITKIPGSEKIQTFPLSLHSIAFYVTVCSETSGVLSQF